ncbi:membrane protein [Helicobacter pylori]|nr:membrane protein [Helicobacter pylori]
MKVVFMNVWYLLLTIILLIIIWRIIRLVLKNKDDSDDKVG